MPGAVLDPRDTLAAKKQREISVLVVPIFQWKRQTNNSIRNR